MLKTENLDQSKLSRQKELYSKWKNTTNSFGNSPSGTIEAVTGFGKTFIGLMAIDEMNERNSDYKALIVVPTRKLKSQWEDLIKGHKLKNTKVMVINTAYKKKMAFNLLVLDEVHNYAAPEFYKLMKNTTYAFIMGLTATIDRKDNRDILLRRHAPVVGTVTMKEARDNNWVSEFVTYNLELDLTTEERIMYDNMNKKYHSHFSMFDHEFSIAMKVLGSKEYREKYVKANAPANITMAEFKEEVQKFGMHAAQWHRLMQARQKFLHNAPCKLKAAQQIIEAFPDKKTITFAQTTDFADELTNKLGDVAMSYHSNLETRMIDGKKYGKTRLKRRALKMLHDGRSKVRVVNTARALDEGFDAEDIELAIISSASSVTRQDIQRTGRAIRFKKGKKAIIVNLFIRETRDKGWLRARQSHNDGANTIWVKSVQELIDHAEGKDISSNTKREELVFKI